MSNNYYIIAFIINWAINILIIEFLAIRKLQPLINVDEKRDAQYPAFRRNDLFWFNRPWLYLTCPFMLFRLTCVFSSLFICAMLCNLAVLGHPKVDPIRGWRYALIRVAQFVTSVIVLACSGVFWLQLNKSQVCYKKYLGPDWKPDYDWRRECGCVVSNHTALHDTFVHTIQ